MGLHLLCYAYGAYVKTYTGQFGGILAFLKIIFCIVALLYVKKILQKQLCVLCVSMFQLCALNMIDMWGLHWRTRKLGADAETQLLQWGCICVFCSWQRSSKINFTSIWDHFWSRSPSFKTLEENKFWKSNKSQSFRLHICIPVKDDDMGIFWGMLLEIRALMYASL